MAGSRRIEGWKLTPGTRAELLRDIPPRYRNVVADHVTFKSGPDNAPMPEADHGVLLGIADDGKGVQALVLAINDSTARPDGSVWHITWSLAEGRRAKESNAVIAEHGWHLHPQRRIPLEPGWWVWVD